MRKEPEYKQINSKFIYSEKSYQRQLDAIRVKKIVTEFDPNLVNPIKVSYRNGFYYVFDGQHTLAALILRNGGQHLMVDCKVYYDLTKEDEARLFAEQNGLAKNVDVGSKMRALYEAKDPDIIKLHDLVTAAGIKFDFAKTYEDNRIVAYKAVYDIYKGTTETDFKTILTIIKQSWNGDSLSLSKDMLQAVTLFYRTFKNDIDISTAIKQFSKETPKSILVQGKIYKFPGAKKYAILLADIYNRKLRNKIDSSKIR